MRAFSALLLAALLGPAAVSPVLAAPASTHKAKAPAAASAGAAATGVTADVRCLMTMIAIGQDKTKTQAAQSGVYFFFGRINERAPGFDLGAAMRAQAPTLDGPALQAEARRCGPMVQTASQGLQTALASLRPPGAAAAPAPVAPAAPAPAPPAPTPTPTPK